MKIGVGILEKSINKTIYSIWESNKRRNINRIFKVLVKDNAIHLEIHRVKKEPKIWYETDYWRTEKKEETIEY